MDNIFIISGKGSFTDDKGNTNHYLVHKLVLGNQGNTVEIKVDKMNWKLLNMGFGLVKTGEVYEDENGVPCDVLAFDYGEEEKEPVAKKSIPVL